MPPKVNLDRVLAQKLQLTNRWLAEYFAHRLPVVTAENPTLPRDIASALIDNAIAHNEDLYYLVGAHEFSPAQYHEATKRLDPSRLGWLLEMQSPPTLDDLHTILTRDDGTESVSLALQHPTWTRFAELTPVHQARFVEKAELRDRLRWVAQQPELTPSLRHKIKRWLGHAHANASLNQAVEYARLTDVLEHHHQHLAYFAALPEINVRRAVAQSRHCRTLETQRRVGRLDEVRRKNSSDTLAQLNYHAPVLVALIDNPHTHESVIDELKRLVDEVHQSEKRRGVTAQVDQQISFSFAKIAHPHRWPSALTTLPPEQDYDTVYDSELLEKLIAAVLQQRSEDPTRAHNVRALLKNKSLSASQREMLEPFGPLDRKEVEIKGVAGSRERFLDLAEQWTTQDGMSGESSSIAVNDHRSWYCDSLDSEWCAAPRAHTTHLLEELGENTDAWNIFLSLGSSWDGTMGELIATTKQLL